MTGELARIMGIDYGDARIGIAVSDLMGWTAQGVTTIKHQSDARDLDEIGRLMAQYDVSELVLGLPKNMNGSIGPRGELSEKFARKLERRFKVPVHLWDERLTTVAAERTLLEADVSRKKRRQVVDKLAATLILQNYLDSKIKR
jgi:putative Holliday junction resolvase